MIIVYQVRKLSKNLSEMKVEQMIGKLKMKEPGTIICQLFLKN